MTTFSSVIYARKNFSNKYIWIVANCILVFFYRIHTFPFYVDEMKWSTQSTIHIVYNLIVMSRVIKQTWNPSFICSKILRVCVLYYTVYTPLLSLSMNRLYFTLSRTDFTFALSIESQPMPMHYFMRRPTTGSSINKKR